MKKQSCWALRLQTIALLVVSLALCGASGYLFATGKASISLLLITGAMQATVLVAFVFGLMPMLKAACALKFAAHYIDSQITETGFEGEEIFEATKMYLKCNSDYFNKNYGRFIKAYEKNKFAKKKRIVDIEDYINAQNVVAENANSTVYSNISILFIAFGIIGALTTILMDIAKFSELWQIMPTISTAIACVLIAVGFYALYLIIYKSSCQYAQNSVDKFLTAFIDNVFAKEDSGDNITNLLLTMSDQQSKQSEAIATLAVAIDEKVTNGLDEAIRPSIEKMANVVKNMVESTTENQTIGIERIVNKLVDCVENNLTDRFTELNQAVSEICDWQKKSADTFTFTIDALSFSAKKLTMLNNRYDKSFDSIDVLSKNMINIVEALQTSGIGLLQMVEMIDKQMVSQGDMFNSFKEEQVHAFDGFREIVTANEATVKSIGQASLAIQEATTQIYTNSGEIMQKVADAAQSVNDMCSTIDVVASQKFEAVCDNFADTLKTLTSQMSDSMVAAVLAEINSLRSLEQRFGENMLQSATRIESTTADIENALAKNLDKIYDMYIDKLSDVSKQLNTSLAAATSEQLSALRVITGKVTVELRDASDSLKQSYFKLGDNVRASYDSTLKSFDHELASITSHLHDTMLQIRDTTDEIPFVLESAFKKVEGEMLRYAKYLSDAV